VTNGYKKIFISLKFKSTLLSEIHWYLLWKYTNLENQIKTNNENVRNHNFSFILEDGERERLYRVNEETNQKMSNEINVISSIIDITAGRKNDICISDLEDGNLIDKIYNFLKEE